MLALPSHRSILSSYGASGNPGAVHNALADLGERIDVLAPHEKGRAVWSERSPRPEVPIPIAPGLWTIGHPAIRVDPDWYPTLIGKWVRGCYWYQTQGPLPAFTRITWRTASAVASNLAAIQASVATATEEVFSAPEFKVRGGILPEDTSTSIWSFTLWNSMTFWGFTGQLAEDQETDVVE